MLAARLDTRGPKQYRFQYSPYFLKPCHVTVSLGLLFGTTDLKMPSSNHRQRCNKPNGTRVSVTANDLHRVRAGSASKRIIRETTLPIDRHCYRSLLDYYLRVYLDTREYLKRARQRIKAMDKNTSVGAWPREQEWNFIQVYEQHKNELKKKLLQECSKRHDHRWMNKFPGIGPVTEAALLSKVDIHKADTVSSLWRFCGLGVDPDGTRQRPIKRSKRTYCAFLKTILIHNLGRLALISTRRSPGHKTKHFVYPQYRAIYDKFRSDYAKNRPAWSKTHIHNASVRRVVKEYVKHLWLRWRQEHKLPTGKRIVN